MSYLRLGLVALASSLALSACVEVSAGDPDLTRVEGNEAGPARGPWLGQAGMFEPYRHGAHLAVLFTVKNMSSQPLTLISAGDPEEDHRLLRRIGVHFALVERARNCDRCAPMPGLSPPFGAVAPAPLTLPSGGEAQVQFNFVMRECQFFSPGGKQTYNATTTIVYRLGETEKTITLDLTGDQVTITAPRDGNCPVGS